MDLYQSAKNVAIIEIHEQMAGAKILKLREELPMWRKFDCDRLVFHLLSNALSSLVAWALVNGDLLSQSRRS